MSNFLAGSFLIVWSLAAMLGNFWFTYGIWPQSWKWFIIFGLNGVVINIVYAAWIKSVKED